MSIEKILFSHSYFLGLDPKQDRWNKPYPPLMTIQAAALIRDAGYQVQLFDPMFSTSPMEVISLLNEVEPDLFVLFDDGFNYLTKMCLTNMREAAWEMAEMARSKGSTVIACSSDATDHCRAYLDNQVDYVLIGEGEQTLLELIQALEQGASLDTIPGIAYLKGDQVIKTPARPVMKQLDELPLPAWDLIDFSTYRQRWESNWGYFSVNIATTRGCPFKCNWCAKPIYGNSYTMRSPQHVIREIEYLHQFIDFDHIWFCDDIFGLKRSWVIEFAELVQECQLDIKYKIQSRADLLVKDQYIEALAASGCEEIWMGVESGSQRILDAMDKGISLEQVRQATAKLKELNIKPCFFIQFGYLSETTAEIKETIDLICELLPHDIGISVSYPLPGTGFYEMVKQDLKDKANWTDSHDLDMMFENTYSKGFYRRLHYFVHQKFRKHLAIEQIKQLFQNPTQLNRKRLKKALSFFYYTPMSLYAKRQLRSELDESAKSL